MPLSLAAGAGNAGMEARGDDFNETPYAALAALLYSEKGRIPRRLWEPFCGNGRLVVPLRNRRFQVLATDLVPRGCPDATAEVDFLSERAESFAATCQPAGIVSNPPYFQLESYVERAVALAPYVALLLRFAFLESERGYGWFGNVGLARVRLIAERLPMMHREGYDGPKQDKGAMPFAWFIFERAAIRRPRPYAGLSVPVHFVSYKEALKKYPLRLKDEPPAAIPFVPPLLRIMAVKSGDNGGTPAAA